MVLNTPEGQQYLATAADSVFLEFPKKHELLNCFWHDMDERYMVISQYSPSFPWVLRAAMEEGDYQTLPLDEADYTLEDTQVDSIITSIGKFMVYSLEKELRETN